ncbi:MAG: hypothetical protein ACR2PI_23770 [Hyphomicrobiaceae bacterium]
MKLIEDIVWALAMLSARRARRHLLLQRRLAFDDDVRPKTPDGATVAYPDAIYHAKATDIVRVINGR